MKVRQLLITRRDGSPRTLADLKSMLVVVDEGKCSTCGETDFRTYEIQVDAFFCSDECRERYKPR